MRSDQNAQPQNQNADFNSGINMLGGMNPDDYQPLTGAEDYRPPAFIPSPSAVPIPRATPVAQQPGSDWRTNAGSFRNNYPVPGTPISYPVPGTPYSGDPLQSPQGFFARLFQSIAGVPGDIGGLLGHLAGHQPPQQSNPSGGMLMSNRTFNSYRSPFAQTYQQLSNPGSMIGPTSGAVTNAYVPGTVLGGRQPLGGPAPGYATAFSNTVKARNII